MVVPTTSSLV